MIDIIKFAEDPEYLGLHLYAKQKEILLELFTKDENGKDRYNELILLCGKGAGKDFLASIIMCYMVYLLEEIPDPQAYYGMAPAEPIDLINVATTSDQATTIFFAKLKARIEYSPYFQNLGFKDYHDRIYFPKHVNCFSAHSRNEVYEGKNVWCGILDEASAFATSGTFGSASSVYQTLYTSMSSRFPINGKVVVMSYPRKNVGDFTADLYEKKKGKKRVLVASYKTWELNEGITREGLQPFYDYDEAAAKRAYECDLSVVTTERFDPELVKLVMKKQAPLIISEQGLSKKLGRSYTSRKLTDVRVTSDKYTIGIDTGLRGSNLAMAIGHRNNGTVVIDQVLEWQPTHKVEVDMENVFDVLKIFAVKNRLEEVWLDQWNSALLNQLLRSEGIESDTVNFGAGFKWNIYEAVFISMRMNQLVLPFDEALKVGFSGVQSMSAGSITNTTDLTDATALCVSKLYNVEDAKKAKPKKKPKVRA